MDFMGENDKITLEAHRDSHAHATDNNGSIKEESKVISMIFIQIPLNDSSSNPYSKGNSQNFLFNLGIIAMLIARYFSHNILQLFTQLHHVWSATFPQIRPAHFFPNRAGHSPINNPIIQLKS